MGRILGAGRAHGAGLVRAVELEHVRTRRLLEGSRAPFGDRFAAGEEAAQREVPAVVEAAGLEHQDELRGDGGEHADGVLAQRRRRALRVEAPQEHGRRTEQRGREVLRPEPEAEGAGRAERKTSSSRRWPTSRAKRWKWNQRSWSWITILGSPVVPEVVLKRLVSSARRPRPSSSAAGASGASRSATEIASSTKPSPSRTTWVSSGEPACAQGLDHGAGVGAADRGGRHEGADGRPFEQMGPAPARRSVRRGPDRRGPPAPSPGRRRGSRGRRAATRRRTRRAPGAARAGRARGGPPRRRSPPSRARDPGRDRRARRRGYAPAFERVRPGTPGIPSSRAQKRIGSFQKPCTNSVSRRSEPSRSSSYSGWRESSSSRQMRPSRRATFTPRQECGP